MHLRRSDVISSDFCCCSIVNSATSSQKSDEITLDQELHAQHSQGPGRVKPRVVDRSGFSSSRPLTSRRASSPCGASSLKVRKGRGRPKAAPAETDSILFPEPLERGGGAYGWLQ